MIESFDSRNVKLTSTSNTEVYQAPNSSSTERSLLLSCFVANISNAEANITVSLTASNSSELSKLAKNIIVPVGASVEIIPNKIVMKTGQKIFAQASTANNLDVTVSVLELTDEI